MKKPKKAINRGTFVWRPLALVLASVLLGFGLGATYQVKTTATNHLTSAQKQTYDNQLKEAQLQLESLVKDYNANIQSYNHLATSWNSKVPVMEAYRAEHPDGTTGPTYTVVTLSCIKAFHYALDQVQHYQDSPTCPTD